jgi:hypothetical protein
MKRRFENIFWQSIHSIQIGFIFLCLYLVQSYSYGQQQLSPYTIKVFQSEFNDEDKVNWPVKEQSDFKHIIADGYYNLSTEIGGKKIYTGLRFNKIPNQYLVTTDVSFKKDGSSWGSIGVVIGAKNKLSNALLVQVNKKNQFRLSRLEGADNIKIISKGKTKADYGWIDIGAKPSTNWMNIKLLVDNNQLLIFIENKLTYTHKVSADETKGTMGYFLDGPANVEVDKLSIFTKAGQKVETEDFSIDKVKEKDIIKPEGTTTTTKPVSGDVTKLASALAEYKKENNELTEQLEDLKIENQLLKNKNTELQQAMAKTNADEKGTDVKKMKDENKRLLKENEALKEEIIELQQYKTLIKKNKDADLIIVLTENLKKEQKINAELRTQIKNLEKKKN